MESIQHATVERLVEDGRTRLLVRGRLTSESASVVLDWLRSWLPTTGGTVGLDLGEVAYLDSAGVAVLAESLAIAESRGCRLDLIRTSEAAAAALSLFRFRGEAAKVRARRVGFLEQIGNYAYGWWQESHRLVVMLADTVFWALAGPFGRLSGAPAGEMQRQTMLLGERAFGIVSLLALLIGATMALLSLNQLRQFGGNIYVADLVAIAMTREMGPLITAIIVAGRSGSAIAAEIATMRVTEEIDALEAMGFSPVRFLVVPKLYAVSLTQPMLTLVADVFGLLGGMLIAVTALQVPFTAFIHRAGEVMEIRDVITGLIKSVVFGWIILVVGAHVGLGTRGGAEGVGLSTTRSVVVSIFMVIVADCIFSLIFYT
jgi:phospholipid/cholesterol/gamma-HCH transport system permease protein